MIKIGFFLALLNTYIELELRPLFSEHVTFNKEKFLSENPKWII